MPLSPRGGKWNFTRHFRRLFAREGLRITPMEQRSPSVEAAFAEICAHLSHLRSLLLVGPGQRIMRKTPRAPRPASACVLLR